MPAKIPKPTIPNSAFDGETGKNGFLNFFGAKSESQLAAKPATSTSAKQENTQNQPSDKISESNKISSHLKDYLLAVGKTGCSSATIRNYRSDINQFLEFLGSEELKELRNKPKLLAFAHYQRDKGLKESSIKRKLVSITQFKIWLKEQGLLTSEIPLSTYGQTADDDSSDDPQRKIIDKDSPKKPEKTPTPEEKNHKESKAPRSRFLILLNLLALLLFLSGLAYFAYQQFGQAIISMAYPSAPVAPNRVLSYQGRLTNTAQSPISAPTAMTYALYDDVSAGTLLWSSNTCTIDPDQDGIFNANLGAGAGAGSDNENCGGTIDDGVFTENSNVWLEVTVGAETLTPRQPIRTVAYALNSATLQGLPPAEIATHSTILMMNSAGEVVLGTDSPIIKTATTSSGLTIEANQIVIKTSTGSDGNILLSPDGTGSVNIGGDLSVSGNSTLTGNTYITSPNTLIFGGTTALGEITSPTDSGAYLIGANDEFTNSNSTNVQGVLNDLDSSIDGLTGGTLGLWTDSGTLTYLTSTSDDFSIGANSLTSPFSVDVSGNVIRFGTGATNNAVLNLYASDGDTGSLTYTTDDAFVFGGGELGLAASSYLNWGSTIGTGGYGLRDSAGTMQFKNSSGTWADIGSGTGSGDSFWLETSGALHPSNDTLDMLVGSNATSSAKFAFLNIAGGTPTFSMANQASIIDLVDTTVNALNIESNLMSFDTTNSRVGIGTATPLALLSLASATTAQAQLNFASSAGVNPSAPVSGDLWWDGTGFKFYNGSTTTDILAGSSLWTDAGTYIYPSSGETLGNSTSAGTNKLAGLYLADSSPLYFGTDNDVNFAFSGSTLTTTLGSNAWNVASNLLYIDGSGSKVGVGANGPDRKFEVLDDTNPQLRLTQADNSIYSDFHMNSNGDLIMNVDGISNQFVLDNGGNIGIGITNPDEKLAINGSVNAEKYYDYTNKNYFLDPAAVSTALNIAGSAVIGGNATASGNVTMGGQLQVGRFDSNPTAVGEGAMIFNTTTNTQQCYNGTNWYNCGGTLYSNSNVSVADGSYITVAHNLDTSDLLSSAWINAQGVWKDLDTTYKPAIAWEGKDSEKGIYHNEVNSYVPGSETSSGANTINDGLLFDTFEDLIKTNSADTTVSLGMLTGDDGSANFITLRQRLQSGRVGLMGGQTYSTATTDNDGQTYLGADAVNDIYYYDRAKDSVPEVLVELGVDPNWYNGVTLSMASSSASLSQGSVLAEKNPNLTTTYNGSLVKASGTYSSGSNARTIYLTVKSQSTFDWSDYNGNAATGVTMTKGVAQALGSTGVSVTFSGGVDYNVGDVFKVASWFTEPESATRGAKQAFPERSSVVINGDYTSIIDNDTQKLWMRTQQVSWKAAASPDATTMLNGALYIASNNSGSSDGNVRLLNFVQDDDRYYYETNTYRATGAFTGISGRNTAGSGNAVISPVGIVSRYANDVAAAVIPNQPTQEVTVSGWGYVTLDGVSATNTETVRLPYKFNSIPVITVTTSGYTLLEPITLNSCGVSAGVITGHGSATTSSFSVSTRHNNDSTVLGGYICYTWTATGSVSPKQFVATSTDGGVTIIDETSGASYDLAYDASNDITTKLVLTNNGTLYYNRQYSSSSTKPLLGVYRNIAGISSDKTTTSTYNYPLLWTTTPAINTTSSDDITSIAVEENNSTVHPQGNTIYLGTNRGVVAIQENYSGANDGDGAEESFASVKYYTKDYISEEMIGDIRTMLPFAGTAALSVDTTIPAPDTDVSVKANAFTTDGAGTVPTRVAGVRGKALSFDGGDYICTGTTGTCADDADLDITTGSATTVGAWIYPTSTAATQMIMSKWLAGGFYLRQGTSMAVEWTIGNGSTISVVSTGVMTQNQWNHVVAVRDGANMYIYINGVLAGSGASAGTASLVNNANPLSIGSWFNGTPSQYFSGSIDEPFVTATALTADQVKNMYQVGYRALQSHGTNLGGAGADTNQKLGYASTGTSSVGVVAPDDQNQFMYVGLNSTTLGGLSKIQLNSDTNVKTYTSSTNVPTGGSLLIDEDVTSLGVGETLIAAGSAASGVKSMGIDDLSTATSGNFVSKTYVLPKNIGSAVLWVSPVLDPNDGSNTLVVKASNDGGSNYATCTLINTNTNPSVPEKEYACTFIAADNDLVVKFEFTRGSTKTNSYVTQYGITWLGETGFKVEQVDDNNVRLYNFSGETQNLKLNVTGASTAALANPWTDAGAYLYPTGYESIRVYDGSGTNYLGLSHDGTLANLTYNGSTVLSINSTGDLLPNTDDTQSLGSATKRWKDLFLGGDTVHIGTNATDEATMGYNTSSNIFNIGTDSTSNGDIAFFTDDLYLDKSAGFVGIGDSTPDYMLDVAGSAGFDGLVTLTGSAANIALGSNYLSGDGDDEGIYVDSTGRVAIGTTTTSIYKLNVISTTPGDQAIRGNVAATSGSNYAGVFGSNGSGAALNVGLYTTASGATSNVGLQITSVAAGANNWALYSDSAAQSYFAGSIGIADTTPSYPLDVTGDIRSTATIRANGSTYFCGGDDACLNDVNVANTVAIYGAQNSALGSLKLGSGGGTISGSGNFIGINNISPSTTLDVIGDALITNTSQTALTLISPDTSITDGQSTLSITDSTAMAINVGGGIALRGVYTSGGASAGFGGIRVGKANGTSGDTGSYLALYSRVSGGAITEGIRLDNNQRVGIGTSTPGTHRLSVVGTAGLSTGTAWTNTSDFRLKDIEGDLNDGSLQAIMALNPVSFRWNDLHHQKFGSTDSKLNYGFIAQEVEAVLPHMISTDEEGYKWYNPSGFEALLTAGIQEQQKQITSLSQIVNQQGSNLDSTGQLTITGDSAASYAVATATGPATKIAAFADIFAARIQTGFISAKELFVAKIKTNVITSEEQQLAIEADALITGNLEVQKNLKVNQDLEVIGGTKLGELTATDATITGQLNADAIQANELDANSARFNSIESKLANLENATVSGTLYAENIEANSISANVISGLQERLTNQIEDTLSQPSLLASLFGEHSQATDEYLEQLNQDINGNQTQASSSADLAALENGSADLTLIADDAFINKYFEVNGNAYVADSLKVDQNFMIGTGTVIGDGFISYQPELALDNDFTFSIQPTGLGKLSLMAGLMQLDSQGFVTISGDLRVAGVLEVADELRAQGTLLTNLITSNQPGESIKVQLASATTDPLAASDSAALVQENNFEFINENQTPVASFSANGDLALTGSLRLGQNFRLATDSGELVATNQRSAGQAVLPTGSTEISISSDKVEENSMIYVTPMNSTNNQVLYVKNKITDSPFTPENEAQFTVAIDYALGQDVIFNWWIVQLN